MKRRNNPTDASGRDLRRFARLANRQRQTGDRVRPGGEACKTYCACEHVTRCPADPATAVQGRDQARRPRIRRRTSPRPSPPPRARPNVLLIMTDDVGFGASSTFGGPIPTPTFDKLAKAGLRFNNFHTTALCSPDAGGAPYRTQPPHLCHRRHHGDGHGLSRLQYADAEKLRHGRGNPQAERLQHVMVRQEPQRARLADEPGGAVRPLAHWPGLRIFLRLHRRRHRSVASSPVRRHQTHRGAARPETITWTRTWPTTPPRGFVNSTRSRRTNRSSSTTLPACATRRITRPRNGSISSRASSTRAGTRCARKRSHGKLRWASFPKAPCSAPDRGQSDISRRGIGSPKRNRQASSNSTRT